MISLIRGRGREAASEQAQSQEVDELFFLSEQVYHRRMAEDWTQGGLAEVAEMTQAQVALLEAGRANPTVRTLVKVACALRCKVGDLFQPVKYESITYTPAARWTKESLEELPYDLLALRYADGDIAELRDGGDPVQITCAQPGEGGHSRRVAWWAEAKTGRMAICTADGDAHTVVVRVW